MVIYFSAKTLITMVFFMMVMIKIAHAQFEEPDWNEDFPIEYEEPVENGNLPIGFEDSDVTDDFSFEDGDHPEPYCPEEFFKFYEECKGSLGSCTKCIQEAEKNCDHARDRSKLDGICGDCTSQFAGRCESADRMCFGSNECAGDHQCINFQCVYSG